MVDLIPGMRNHIRSIAAPKGPRLGRTLSDAGAVDANEDYSVIFKELFCVAAQDLAEQIHEPLENIGVLYNDIMSTGTIEIKKKGMQSTVTEAKDGSHDIEEGRNSSIFGRGQLLFVVRLANKVEATRLQASGFRFADTLNVADHLARSMRVTREELLSRVNDMREYSKRDRILEPGVHIACFAIRPLIRRFFDVLVRKNATNLLPTIRMPLKELDATHLEILRQMDGWTVAACLNWLRSKLSFANKSEEVFVGQLYDSFTALVQEVQDPFFLRARFVGHPMTAPCRSLKEGQVPGKATVLTFCIMTDIHASTSNSRLTFSPFNLFKCQQYVYENAKDHEKFAKEVHREFAPILQSDVYPYFNASSQATPNSSNLARDDNTRSPTSGVNWSWPFSNKTPHSQAELVKDDNSSERSLVEGGSNKAFGGITVRNEIRVDISDALNHSDDDVELGSMPTHKAPSLAAAKGDGFVDELFALTVDSSRW